MWFLMEMLILARFSSLSSGKWFATDRARNAFG